MGRASGRRACTSSLILVALLGTRVACASDEPDPLHVAVMDPLAAPLACPCVAGHAQRDYQKLADFLRRRLECPVRVSYGESLAEILKKNRGRVDLIVGKQSMVLFDAAETQTTIRPIALLTDKNGRTTLTGWFVVRQDDPAKTIADLKGYRIRFGPTWATEKHGAALAALKAARVPLPQKLSVTESCNAGALDVLDRQADAAVISSYAFALLEGCKTVPKGSLRIVGQTEPVPFVTVFATQRVTPERQRVIVAALPTAGVDQRLLVAMESKDGFVSVDPPAGTSATAGWTDWRGSGRRGLSPYAPRHLPASPRLLWRRPLSNVALSGVAATSRRVIVADKNQSGTEDVFRCLEADTGRELWALRYRAAGQMDYSNSPRATPVIHQGLVYLLGAFGHLHCVRLEDGEVVWKKNIVKDFGAELVTWGMCSTPLIVDDKLIVNPGAKDAAVVALDRRTGELRWKSPGAPAAYASFIVGTFGGVRQIVGYDAESLGGWDPQTGSRLWQLVPQQDAFNVPTPIDAGGRLLVSTENNGTRVYDFESDGRIKPRATTTNLELAPDASTPVLLNGMVFGCSGALFCLDLDDGLRKRWVAREESFEDYVTLIAGDDSLLITTTAGELLLVRATGERYVLESRLRLFEHADLWSHPALVGNRLYVRDKDEIACILLNER